jgi:hypothetical protein
MARWRQTLNGLGMMPDEPGGDDEHVFSVNRQRVAYRDDASELPARILGSPDIYFNPEAGLGLSGIDINSWTDQIRGLTALGVGAARPTSVISSALGGRAAIRCNQDLQQKLQAADDQHLTHVPSEYTWHIVVYPTRFHQAVTAPQYITRQYMVYAGNDYNGAGLERIAWALKANANQRSVHGYSDNAVGTPWKTSTIMMTDRPQVISIRNSSTTGGAFFVDGVKMVDGLSYIPRPFENGFALFGSFGEPAVGADTYCDGDFGDIIGHLRAQTDQEIAAQAALLRPHYSITNNLATYAGLLPELWINAVSNYALVSGAVNEVGNQGLNKPVAPSAPALSAPLAGDRPLVSSIVSGGITYPCFDFDNTDYLTGASTGFTWNDLITQGGDWVGRAVVAIDAVDTDSGSGWLNDAILADASSNFSPMAIRSSTGAYGYAWDGSAKVTPAIGLGGFPTVVIRLRVRRSGANMFFRVGAGAEQSVGVGTLAAAILTDAIHLGRRGTSATLLDSKVIDVFWKRAPSGSDLTALDAADAIRFPGAA